MILPSAVQSGGQRPTIWGLTPTQLHDRFWAARGVQVVRVGERPELVRGAELFLLTAPQLLCVFRLRALVDKLSWLDPDVLWVRLQPEHDRSYREIALAGPDGQFLGFRREYGGSDARLARVALTPKREIASRWQAAGDASSGWRMLRQEVPRARRASDSAKARTYDRTSDRDMAALVRELVKVWHEPSATVARARKIRSGVWGDTSAEAAQGTRFVGPAWIGAGRELSGTDTVVGPVILWDDPAARPAMDDVEWEELEPTKAFNGVGSRRPAGSAYTVGKRMFDLAFASLALILVLPLFPFIMLALYLEDGRPFFFGHRREGKGGKRFTCWKFRSMRRDAGVLKAAVAARNEVDGPQFFIEDDPRVTRVGGFLRRYFLDELPQFFNVLAGDMSVVGPRPSPYEENQYCPAWREARLSVRPGITGLWQVKRTRKAGRDFQEWIKYDIEYVEKASFGLDMGIIWRTFGRLARVVLRQITRRWRNHGAAATIQEKT